MCLIKLIAAEVAWVELGDAHCPKSPFSGPLLTISPLVGPLVDYPLRIWIVGKEVFDGGGVPSAP
jgi:hypothetical protein